MNDKKELIFLNPYSNLIGILLRQGKGRRGNFVA